MGKQKETAPMIQTLAFPRNTKQKTLICNVAFPRNKTNQWNAWPEGSIWERLNIYMKIDRSVGHSRNGPYDLNNIACDLQDAESRKDEIVEVIRSINYGKMPHRVMEENH